MNRVEYLMVLPFGILKCTVSIVNAFNTYFKAVVPYCVSLECELSNDTYNIISKQINKLDYQQQMFERFPLFRKGLH
jgi:hypothetical protein